MENQKYYKVNRLEGLTYKNRREDITDESPRTLISNININNTLIVSHSIRPYDDDTENSTTKYISSNIWLYDNATLDYKSLFANDNSMFFNGNLLVDNANLIAEVNNSFYPAAADDVLTTSNIIILGQPTTHNGYINFSQTQGNGGIGIRYNKSTEKIQYRNASADAWQNLTNTGNLALLADVQIDDAAAGEVLAYNAGAAKWENTNALDLRSLTVASNIYVGETGSGVNIGDIPIITFDKIGEGNHINVLSYGTPRLAAAGNDANIDISLAAKGSGDVNIIGDRTNVVGNLSISGSIDFGGSMRSSVVVYPNEETPPWNAGELSIVQFALGVDIIYFAMRGKPTGTYYAGISSVGIETGYNLTIFYDTGNDGNNLYVDMGANSIVGGNGDTARYLVFTRNGQSARLVFIGVINDTDGENSLNKWHLVGSGCGLV